MKVKVCGIKDQSNLDGLLEVGVDMIGFNFYQPSKRYLSAESNLSLAAIEDKPARVGVFVNAELSYLEGKKKYYNLDYLQLHGDEDTSYLAKAKKLAPVIKVFRINETFDFETTKAFEDADLFLFDTYTKAYGGSGLRFDWSKLDDYKGNIPFLLAGGISPSDARRLKEINHPQLYGVDINSGFEIEPGLKDLDQVRAFVSEVNNDNN